MYSPGSLKVAVVVTLPVKAVFGGALKSALSAPDLALAITTSPGPRYLLHVTDTAGCRLCGAPGTRLASSATHAVKGSGSPTTAFRVVLTMRGPCANGPPSENPTNGGVLPVASTNGESSQSG